MPNQTPIGTIKLLSYKMWPRVHRSRHPEGIRRRADEGVNRVGELLRGIVVATEYFPFRSELSSLVSSGGGRTPRTSISPSRDLDDEIAGRIEEAKRNQGKLKLLVTTQRDITNWRRLYKGTTTNAESPGSMIRTSYRSLSGLSCLPSLRLVRQRPRI